ncbi:DUF4347 domain-containing protein [Pantanalinema sp. GBBB05]|uniref:DUF4347 domain-containing protein n=1 Tax=Pantanalinema sp. GBBB05 TaxID=2604139 RepID=UPI001D5AABEF|nr:DUF4347 domain-containing protein [Pantanalinema sp. GBBB05]
MEPLFPSANALSDLNTAPTPLVPPDPLTSPVAPLPPFSGSSASLLVIDSTLDNYQELVAGVKADTEVVVLDPVQDAIAQITQALTGRTGIESLHIVSRGLSAGLQLGNTQLDNSTLPQYTSQIASWKTALSADADIVIYGSEVANDPLLTQRPTPFLPTPFLVQLARLTGADIAASTDITGSSDFNGNWNFEYTLGQVESPIAFQPETLANYHSTLSLTVTPTGDTLSYANNAPAIAITPSGDSDPASSPTVAPFTLEITGL